jgi:hypothetical protein
MTFTHPVSRLAAIAASLAVPAILVVLTLRTRLSDAMPVQTVVVVAAASLGAIILASAVPREQPRRGVVAWFSVALLTALGMYLLAHRCLVLGECL